jgi:hypothetical protein
MGMGRRENLKTECGLREGEYQLAAFWLPWHFDLKHRPQFKDPNLTKDEKDRREKRRERNKQAAARCRRRREERMQTLEEASCSG